MSRSVCQIVGHLLAVALPLIFLGSAIGGVDPSRTPTAEMIVDEATNRAEFRIHGLDPAALAKIASEVAASETWWRRVPVSVDSGRDSTPPMLGSYRVSTPDLIFTPRYPLDRSISRYVVEIDPSLIVSSERNPPRKLRLTVESRMRPERATGQPRTAVEAVYPSRATLPENLLRFYFVFSAPMSRGGAYDHIRLLDGAGRPIADPFLELGEELWSVDGRRFTLLFDPGRIKRGLKPREEVGPVLEMGKSYTLVISAEWPDALGNPLGGEFRKPFRVGSPDETVPDPRNWKFHLPRAGSVDPLVLRFPEPLDRALAERLIAVKGPAGEAVAGKVRLESDETVWKLKPQKPWEAGLYQTVIGTDLEDLAGNSIGRRFEVDLVEPITASVRESTVTILFRIDR